MNKGRTRWYFRTCLFEYGNGRESLQCASIMALHIVDEIGMSGFIANPNQRIRLVDEIGMSGFIANPNQVSPSIFPPKPPQDTVTSQPAPKGVVVGPFVGLFGAHDAKRGADRRDDGPTRLVLTLDNEATYGSEHPTLTDEPSDVVGDASRRHKRPISDCGWWAQREAHRNELVSCVDRNFSRNVLDVMVCSGKYFL
ncbi:hypothetical protein Pelo_6869 [Pelomyxa schiedti]|nr:hypothetical protein Pelo_6869 [Pelomyxa schiedti]